MVIPDWVVFGVAGALGGAVRLLSRPEEGWLRRFAVSGAGGIVAIYGTPVVAPIAAGYLAGFDVPMEGVYGLCGFLLGMTGLSLCEGVIRIAKAWLDNPKLPPKV